MERLGRHLTGMFFSLFGAMLQLFVEIGYAVGGQMSLG
jgi:hypothetical protein